MQNVRSTRLFGGDPLVSAAGPSGAALKSVQPLSAKQHAERTSHSVVPRTDVRWTSLGQQRASVVWDTPRPLELDARRPVSMLL